MVFLGLLFPLWILITDDFRLFVGLALSHIAVVITMRVLWGCYLEPDKAHIEQSLQQAWDEDIKAKYKFSTYVKELQLYNGETGDSTRYAIVFIGPTIDHEPAPMDALARIQQDMATFQTSVKKKEGLSTIDKRNLLGLDV